MAGDPQNASVWPDADVYVGSRNASHPDSIDEEFGPDWGLVGLLDGDAGLVESREWDESDHFAWGGILVRTTRRQFKLTKQFTALEYNEVTRELIWPGSSSSGLIIPRPVPVAVAFETREVVGDTDKRRRLISANYAEISVEGDITESESELTSYEMVATIYPTGAGVLFIEQEADSNGNGNGAGGQSVPTTTTRVGAAAE